MVSFIMEGIISTRIFYVRQGLNYVVAFRGKKVHFFNLTVHWQCNNESTLSSTEHGGTIQASCRVSIHTSFHYHKQRD